MDTHVTVTIFLLFLCAQGITPQTTLDPDSSVTTVTPFITTDNDSSDLTITPAPQEPPEPELNCSDTSDWYNLDPRVCFQRVYLICKLQTSPFEFNCICRNQCDPPTTQEAVEEDIDCNDQDSWIDYGFSRCIDIVFYDCGLDLKRTEYMCICQGLCDKTEAELDEIHGRKSAVSKRERDLEHYIVKGIVYSIIFLLGIFGNLLVIITIARFMGRSTVTNIYICNLAVADLLVILICVPTKAIETIYMVWEFGDVGCKIIAWLYFASFMWSSFTLMCMSLERYMVINHPMMTQKMSSKKRTGIIVGGIWVLGLALSLPTFFLAEEYKETQCLVSPIDQIKKRSFYIYIFTAIFLIPSCLMGFAYIRTSVTLWKSVQKQREMKKSGDGEKSEKSADTSGRIQVIRVLIGVLVVFVVCWAPYLTYQIYTTTNHHRSNIEILKRTVDIAFWFNFLSLANSALNPLLYGFLSRQFRMGFLRCLTCNKKGKEVTKSYITTSGGGATSMTSRVTTATTAVPMKAPVKTAEPQENGAANPASDESENKM